MVFSMFSSQDLSRIINNNLQFKEIPYNSKNNSLTVVMSYRGKAYYPC